MKHLFLLPHQDDEVFAYLPIETALAKNEEVYFCFLTQGLPTQTLVRNQESIRVLMSWGVARERISFLSTSVPILDGHLLENLELAYVAILKEFSELFSHPMCLWSPDWEGGHADHDSAFLIGQKIRQHFFPVVHHSFSLYRIVPNFYPFFYVGIPLKKENSFSLPLRLKQRLKVFLAIFSYRSQTKTWLGITPFLLLTLFTRTQLYFKANPRFELKRPHEGDLFYERRFRVPYATVEKNAKIFLS